MPYTNDAQTLADVMSPVDAAMQSAQQNGAANIAEAIKNQVSAGQAPADIQKPYLQNALTQAQTYGEQGLGLQQNAKGLADMFAAPSAAQAQVSGNQLKVSTDQLTKMNQLGQMTNAIAAQMDNIPEAARPAAMQQIAQKYGIDPQTVGNLMSGDPQLLRQFSQAMIQGSAGYQQTMAEQTLRNTGAANVAEISGNARVTSAETTAAARVQVANVVKQMREQQQTFEQAAVRLQSSNPELAQKYAQMAVQLRQAQAGITSQMVTGAPLTLPDLTSGGGQPSGGTQAPSTPPTGGNALESEMRRRGLIK